MPKALRTTQLRIGPSERDNVLRRPHAGRSGNAIASLGVDDFAVLFCKRAYVRIGQNLEYRFRRSAEAHAVRCHDYGAKRAERLEEVSKKLPWPHNVWMGVSVENADYLYRIGHLRRTKAKTKFLSLEPLLGPLEKMDLRGIDWAIAGGESGPGARPMPKEWVRSIRDQCAAADVPFHFKQWGGKNKKKTGRTLDGRTWDEWPSIERRRTRPTRAAVTSASR